MTKALFAGSFDPITNGHLDIISSASKIFEKLIVAVAYNPNKSIFIPIEDRLNLIKDAIAEFSNVEVVSYNGLTVDYAQKNNINVLIRGVRSVVDFDYEMSMALMNKKINSNINTCIMFASPENQSISSSSIREIQASNGNIKQFVPFSVYEYLLNNTSIR